MDRMKYFRFLTVLSAFLLAISSAFATRTLGQLLSEETLAGFFANLEWLNWAIYIIGVYIVALIIYEVVLQGAGMNKGRTTFILAFFLSFLGVTGFVWVLVAKDIIPVYIVFVAAEILVVGGLLSMIFKTLKTKDKDGNKIPKAEQKASWLKILIVGIVLILISLWHQTIVELADSSDVSQLIGNDTLLYQVALLFHIPMDLPLFIGILLIAMILFSAESEAKSLFTSAKKTTLGGMTRDAKNLAVDGASAAGRGASAAGRMAKDATIAAAGKAGPFLKKIGSFGWGATKSLFSKVFSTDIWRRAGGAIASKYRDVFGDRRLPPEEEDSFIAAVKQELEENAEVIKNIDKAIGINFKTLTEDEIARYKKRKSDASELVIRLKIVSIIVTFVARNVKEIMELPEDDYKNLGEEIKRIVGSFFGGDEGFKALEGESRTVNQVLTEYYERLANIVSEDLAKRKHLEHDEFHDEETPAAESPEEGTESDTTTSDDKS